MVNLIDASTQWANRPADQRFTSLQELHAHCLHFKHGARTKALPTSALHAIVRDGALRIAGPEGGTATMTNWAFGQLSQRAEAPAGYLRTLPVELAADCLNQGLRSSEGSASLLFHQNGDLSLHAATSDQYARIWNADLTERLLDLMPEGWRPPPARPSTSGAPGSRLATADDCSPHTLIKPGDMIAPAGLYASDRDMFAFLVNDKARIDDGSDGGLARGFFVSNSEVGDKAFSLKTFLYRYVCGNHIVWDASKVIEVRLVHKGDANRRAFQGLRLDLRAYAEGAASEDEARIKAAQRFIIADSRVNTLDLLFGKRIAGRKMLEAAFDLAEEHADTDGHPRSAWGYAQGLTRLSQASSYTDDRANLDAAAGKVLEMAF